MGSTRLKGTKLSLKIGDVEYMGDVTSWSITNEDRDADVVTFEDAANGNTRAFLLAVGLVQSTAPDSLFMHVWDHPGETATYTLAPHGNEVPTVAEPHFTGSLTMPNPGEFGGEAGPATFTSEVAFSLDAKPTKVTSVEG